MNKKHGAIVLFIFLMLFWVIISSKLDVISLTIGVMVSLLVVFYNYDLIFNQSEMTKLTFKKLLALIVLGFFLMINIVKSNIEVAKIVLSPKMSIHPGFKKIKQPLKKEVNRAMFGNAITLTPGTLTVDMNDDEILVHALNVEQVDGINQSAVLKSFLIFEEETS